VAILGQRHGQRLLDGLGQDLDGVVAPLSGFRAGLEQRDLGQVLGIVRFNRPRVAILGCRKLPFFACEEHGLDIVQRGFDAMGREDGAFA
jgi:hypothetical protein